MKRRRPRVPGTAVPSVLETYGIQRCVNHPDSYLNPVAGEPFTFECFYGCRATMHLSSPHERRAYLEAWPQK